MNIQKMKRIAHNKLSFFYDKYLYDRIRRLTILGVDQDETNYINGCICY